MAQNLKGVKRHNRLYNVHVGMYIVQSILCECLPFYRYRYIIKKNFKFSGRGLQLLKYFSGEV